MSYPYQIVKEGIDKFKVDETAPIFSVSPTGSYGDINSGLKSQYLLKFKHPETKNVTKTSGLLSNNLNVLPLP